MQINIEVIKVSKPEHKAGKGRGYDVIEVTYKDLTAGKVGGKKLVSFGDYVHVYEAAKDWTEGQEVRIELQKVDGYWNWVNVVDGDALVKESPKQEKGTDPVPTKQQWVPDEVRQRMIVRQSSIDKAITFEAGNNPTLEDVFKTAERIVDWVYEVEKQADAPKRGRKPKIEVIEVEVE